MPVGKPSLGRYEERIWRPNATAGYGGRRHRRPMKIRCFVPDPLAEWDPTLTAATAEIIGQADRMVDRLNHDAPGFAGIEALSRQLLRQESVASSRIEGLAMGQRRLARAAMQADGDEAASQIVGNIRAMELAIAIGSEDRPFTYGDLIAIHTTLLEATRDSHWAGVVREEQNWIGGSDLSPARARFIPPPKELVHELLRDLVTLINRDDLPATLQAAAVHAHFETIHAFLDGNGRVGRCLIHVVLRRSGLASNVVPPISPILATMSDRYIRGLGQWRGQSPHEWLLHFAGVTIAAVEEARELARMVEQMQSKWLDRLGHPRRDAASRRLIDHLPGEPIVNVSRAAELLGVSAVAAGRAINQLEDHSVIKVLTERKRNRLWEAPDVFDLLDDFERHMTTRL